MEDLSKCLDDNQILIYTVSNREYLEKLVSLIKTVIKKNYNKIVYITLNRPHEAITEILKKNELPEERFFFIDASQRNFGMSPNKNNVYANPSSLTDISIQVFNALEKGENINILLVDPLSTLLVYNSDISVMKFVHFIVSGIRQTKNKVVFIFLKEDTNKPLFNDLSMFSDKIVEI